MYTETEQIDPIGQLMQARNKLMNAVLYLKELPGIPGKSDTILELYETIESLNLIQRWFMRNSHVIDNDMFLNGDH